MRWDRWVVAGAAFMGLAGAGTGLYVKAALSDTERRLALLERQDVVFMDQLRIEQSYRRAVLAKLDALCRATPRANCPLGENEK